MESISTKRLSPLQIKTFAPVETNEIEHEAIENLAPPPRVNVNPSTNSADVPPRASIKPIAASPPRMRFVPMPKILY